MRGHGHINGFAHGAPLAIKAGRRLNHTRRLPVLVKVAASVCGCTRMSWLPAAKHLTPVRSGGTEQVKCRHYLESPRFPPRPLPLLR
jgi:hypothetical protein